MTPHRRLHPLGFMLLALSLVLAHVPLSGVQAGTPGALVQVAALESAPGSPSCCGGCASEDQATPDAPQDTGAPCCPSGCTHCSLPCCSSPLAPARPDPESACDLAPAPRVEPLLPSYTSALSEGVFHPPRR